MAATARVLSFLLLGVPCLCAQQFARATREALPLAAQWQPPYQKSALTDLDGDGALDVVFSGIHYYHNDGRGRFTLVPLPAPAASTTLLGTGDFDGDADLDVLMTGGVLENRGPAGPAFVPGNVSQRLLAVGDLNGDGRDDLVLPGSIGLATSVATFTIAFASLNGAIVTGAAVGDLDGDGDRDIVWATTPQTITQPWPWPSYTIPGYEQVTLNNGNGTFAAAVLLPGTPDDSTSDVVALDADGDGDLDLGFLSGYSWRFWRNQGSGTFAPWSGLPFAARPLEVHDLDRDGDPDLVGDDRWYENGGAGSFTERSIPLRPSELHALGDVDGDLDVDLVCAGLGIAGAGVMLGRDRRLLLNQGSQEFVEATAAAWSATPGVANYEWRRGDVDGDGFADLIEAGGTLWRGRGDGWHEPTPFPLASVPLLVDLDTDGDLDLLDGMWAWNNGGTGTFVSAGSITITPWNPYSPWLAFDADGDGDADLLDIDLSTLTILRNEGALQFTALPLLTLPTSSPEAAAVADFDGDADLDLLIGFSGGGGTIHRFVNDGTGTFTHDPAGVVGATGTAVATLAIADLDLDGDPDVLAGRFLGTAPRHLVLRNTGSVLVADPTAVPAQDAAVQAALGDVDGDGDPDAVVGIDTGGVATFSLALWINDGTGRFTFAEDLGLPLGDAVQLADVDRDGDADLFGGYRLSLNRHWHIEAPFIAQTGTVYTLRFGGRALPNALALPWFGWPASVQIPGLGTVGLDPATGIPLGVQQLSGEMGELSFTIPPIAAFVGMQFAMQAILLSGGTLHLTPPKIEIVRS